jgi:DNA-binding HxlR family transcriptional regulator
MPVGAVQPEANSRSGGWGDGVASTIETTGDAWSWLVMREAIVCGITRFDSFQRHLGIARSTLTARLDTLCSGGLLVKANRATAAKPEYRLTPSGSAFTTCLLMAMNWGDRWLPSPDGPPLLVEHTACGSTTHVQMRCTECAREIKAREVEFTELPPAPVPARKERARAPGVELLERTGPCSIARTLKVTGDRWSSLVLRGAFVGLRRFDQFEQALGIAPNVLSQRLARLVELGVLHKEPYGARPPRYEYRLSDRGLDLYPMYVAMLAWGTRWTHVRGEGVQLWHTPCGQRLNPIACCAACGTEVARSGLLLHNHGAHTRL